MSNFTIKTRVAESSATNLANLKKVKDVSTLPLNIAILETNNKALKA